MSDAPAGWNHPVLLTTALAGGGIAELADALERHHEWMAAGGELLERRRRRLAARTKEVVERAMRRWIWEETRAEELIRGRLEEVATGALSPYELANEIVSGLKEGARV
ncbi:MAG: hypothetical protein HOP28_15570 [Gemmatimonadales bacterium]|nr:hypothetical protein [Gemmatimonadales bacterium]